MRIAIVSQYYPPEPGATQNRVGTFAESLAIRGHDVTVVCEQPNHPAGVFQSGFGKRPWMTERRGRLTIRRLWVVASPRKTAARRLAFYTSYAVGAAATLMAGRSQDVVLASSPPLVGALAAGAVARIRGTPFVLDVRDVWPAAAVALGEISNPQLIRMLERAERWLYRTSSHVIATTRPFCVHIDSVAGRRGSSHVPNGALDEMLALPTTAAPDTGRFVLGYAGNLGIAQGLGIIFDAAELLHGDKVGIVLVGDGPLSEELRRERDRRGLTSIEIRPSLPVAEVAGFMQSCNALLVPLGAHPLLRDFIPSKLYDAMAVGRPAIVAAHGEAAALIEESQAGISIPPEDGEALAAAVRELAHDRERACRLGSAGRRSAAKHARSFQIDRLEAILVAAAGASTKPRPPELSSDT